VKKIMTLSVLSIVALGLTACGASAGSSQSNSSNASSGAIGSAGSSNPAPGNGTPAAGPSALQLAVGMLKLDGTSNAVSAQQAAQLLPLWQSLRQIETTAATQSGAQGTPGARPDPATMQQVGAQIVLIQNAMTPAQIQAIAAMNLNRQDIFAALQQAGIQIGGPGQGGGFRPNGGTFTPPQGTPPAAGTPGGFQRTGGNFGGGRAGFGNFIPQSVVDGIVQFLQKRAGS
jgi:hypothetical protein